MSFSLSTEIDLSSELDHRPAPPLLHEAGKGSDRRRPRALALCGLALAAAAAAFALACLITGRLPWEGSRGSHTVPRFPEPAPAHKPARSASPAKPVDNRRDPPPKQSSATPTPPGPEGPVPQLTSPPAQKHPVAVRPLWAQNPAPQPGRPQTPRDRPATRPARRTGFDPKPYFSGPDNPAARLRQKDLTGARAAAERLSTDAGFKHRKQAQFVLALVLAKKGECAKALLILGNLEATYPLLKPYVLVETAKCHLRLKQPARAEQAALKVDQKSPLAEAAQLLNGVALMHQRKWAQTVALYRRYLNSRPRDGVAESRYYLAVALEKTNAPLKQILPQLRLIRADFPLTLHSRKALARMRKLLMGKPGKVRRYWLRLPCRLAVVRARKLMSARKYRRAVTELRSAILKRDCSVDDRCAAHYHLAQATFKGISRKRSAPLFERAVHRCDPAGPKDLRAKAKYQAGRANRARRRYARALAFFRRVEREHPHHSYADDARLRRAETYRLMRKKNLAMYSYKTLVKRYPKGDMRQEALWRITRQTYFDGKHTQALKLLNLAARTVTREKGPHAEGRTFYWKGRVLTRLGRPSDAIQAYTRAVRTYPLSYYALLSLERVRQLNAQTASRLQAEMAPDRAASNWTFATDPVFKSAGFKRAVELARLGLARRVLKELSHLGLKVPQKPPKPKEHAALTPTRRTRLWATAVLLDRVGLFHLSHWLPRHTLRKYRAAYPRGANLKYWQVAFPTAFKKLVNANAARFQVPAELLMALIREESAFNPRQVSRARAIGLTQLLITTARRFARKLRLRITVATLKRPEINVPVGARYLGWLLRLFKGRKTLAVAAYNCGERRIKRWVRSRRNLEVDEFVELIPIDETRKYTKRVLGSAFAYRALGRPASPSVPIAFKLPAQASGPTRAVPSKVAIRR